MDDVFLANRTAASSLTNSSRTMAPSRRSLWGILEGRTDRDTVTKVSDTFPLWGVSNILWLKQRQSLLWYNETSSRARNKAVKEDGLKHKFR